MNNIPPARRFFLKFSLFPFLLALIVFSAWQCFQLPDEPVLPNWDIPLTIPLVDTVYYLKDAFNSNSDISIVDSVFMYGPKHYDFAPVNLGDNLQLNPPTLDTTTTKKIGTLNINPPAPFSHSLKLSQIIQPITISRPILGDTTIIFRDDTTTSLDPVCDFGGNCIFTELSSQSHTDTIAFPPDTSEFEYIKVFAGSFDVSIQNNLPVSVYIVSLQILNADNTPLAIATNRTITAGTTLVLPFDLSGQKLTDSLTAVVQESTQTSPLPLVFNQGAGIAFSLGFSSSLATNEAKFRLPAIPLIPDTTFTEVLVDDSTFITQGEFSSGSIQISVTNNIAASDKIFFRFVEFVNKNTGLPFKIDTTIPPHGFYADSINLIDYKLVGSDTSNHITYEVAIQTIQGNGLDTVRASDSISVRIVFNTPITVKSVEGKIKPFTKALNDTIDLSEIELGSNFIADSLRLSQDTLLRVFIGTATGHPADFHLTLKTLRNDTVKNTFSIQQNANIPPGLQSPDPTAWRFLPGYTNVISFTGNQLSDFLTNFPGGQPNRLVIENTPGDFIINPYDVYNGSRGASYPGYIAKIEDTTKLYTSAEFTVPLKVAIYNGIFTDSLNISDTSSNGVKIDSNLVKYVLGGSFTFFILNKIPVGLGLKSTFYSSTGDSLVKSFQIAANTDTTQKAVITLTTDEAKKFNTAKTGLMQIFMGTGNQIAVFDTTQYIRIGMSASIRFNVNPEELTRNK